MRAAIALLLSTLLPAAAGCAQILDYRELEPAAPAPADDAGRSSPGTGGEPPSSEGPDPTTRIELPRASTCGPSPAGMCDDFARTSIESGGWIVHTVSGGSVAIEASGAERSLALTIPSPPSADSAAFVTLAPALLVPRASTMKVSLTIERTASVAGALVEVLLGDGSKVRVMTDAQGRLGADEVRGAGTTQADVTSDVVLTPGRRVRCALELDLASALLQVDIDDIPTLGVSLEMELGETVDVRELRIGLVPNGEVGTGGTVRVDDVAVSPVNE